MGKIAAKAKKAVLKVALSAAMSFAVLVFVIVGVVAVFGWFNNNGKTDAAGMKISLGLNCVQARYYVYAYDTFDESARGATDKYVVYDSQKKSIVTRFFDVGNFVMNPYDMVFVQRNAFTPVVIRIEIIGEVLPDSGNVTLTVMRDTLKDQSSLAYFSSVVKFSCVKGAEMLSESVAGTFDNVAEIIANGSPLGKDYFKTAPISETVKAFIYESGENYAKHDRLFFTTDYSRNDFNGNSLNLYLYFDYDKRFIEEFITESVGENFDISGDGLSAENDLFSLSAYVV